MSAMFERYFPERQFYHRSHGEVHFVSLSGRTQFVYLTLTLGFLTWVGYASVNVVFKEQIISKKERDFIVMQKQYEQRIVDMQSAFDEVNAVLVRAEENFTESTEDLEERHRLLETLVERRQALNERLDGVKQTLFARRQVPVDQDETSNVVMMRVTDGELVTRRSRRSGDDEENRVAAVRIALANMLRSTVSRQDEMERLRSRVTRLQEQVDSLRERQQDLIFALEEESQTRIAQAKGLLSRTPVGLDDIVSEFVDEGVATGGPFIDLGDMELLDDEDSVEPTQSRNNNVAGFRRDILRLSTQLEEVALYEKILVTIPLADPVNDKNGWRRTSRFGPRIDPFSKRRAFHSGLDMAGRRGADVVATAPGVVTHAGPKGPYGNMVEIDHGFGFKTRYGHLQKVLVERGEKVKFYQKIALLGSTGRSTGPHLHYEVVFNNKVKNPVGFLEAGNYVFTE